MSCETDAGTGEVLLRCEATENCEVQQDALNAIYTACKHHTPALQQPGNGGTAPLTHSIPPFAPPFPVARSQT